MGIFKKADNQNHPLLQEIRPLMKAFVTTLIFCCAFTLGNTIQAQTVTTKADNNYIQFSGVVLDQDSLTPIPFVSILIKGTKRGTVSDVYGFFSMIISPGDELQFLSLTHKGRSYKVPDTIRQKYHYAIQVLTKDTVELATVDVYPWPSREDFKRAFLALDLNESDGDRADRNLTREELSYMERTQPASSSENYRYVMQAYYTKVYTSGQQPVNNLMNPIKWAEFINAWRSGKFKNKAKKD